MSVHRLAAARQPRRSPRSSHPAVTVRVDPLAWAKALALAGGNRQRLRVIDQRTVLVVNPR